MVVEARVKLRHRGCYSETLPPGVQVTHLSGDDEHCICTIRGPPGADLDAVVASLGPWLDAPPRVLDRGALSLAVRCSCPTRGLRQRLAAWGATVMWPVVHRDGHEWWHLVAPTREVMAHVLERLGSEGEVEVERLGNPSPDELGVSLPLGELTRELSARQLAVLRFAIERGYYANPRAVTLDALARGFGLSRSTFQEHLQKAEERVMKRFGGVVAGHPALVAAAMRRAGRPPRGEGSGPARGAH